MGQPVVNAESRAAADAGRMGAAAQGGDTTGVGAARPEPSPEQLLLLRLRDSGQTPDELAAALHRTRAEVQALLRDAVWRLDVRSVSEAIAEARRRGLLG
ncbi:MAG TPA: hypothetical protein VFY16_04225 [Gemmatimonadaceae bacterium]|nr:hypothetical protein [Gemmatimonadaceae bacterium]